MAGFSMEDYVDVATRIAIFREKFPEGSLQSEVVQFGPDVIVIKAFAYRTPDDPRPGIGHASEVLPGRTPYTKDSELMVCETSAWGRAIVAALAADTKRVASKDEVARAEAVRSAPNGKAKPTLKAVAQPVVTPVAADQGAAELDPSFATPEQWQRLVMAFGSKAAVVKRANAVFEGAVRSHMDLTLLQAQTLLDQHDGVA